MGSQQQFCLRWNNHQSNMLNLFDQLLQNEALVDVTLACDGLSIKAHKVVLSACSPYFQSLFAENPCQHPIVFMKDVQYNDLRALVDFMYKGEVNVNQEQLNAVLETAESLKVRGLTEVTTTETSLAHHHHHHHHHQQQGQQTTNGEGDNNYSCAKILPITGNGYNAGIEPQQHLSAHHQPMDFHSSYLHHHHHHSGSGRPMSQSPPPASPKMSTSELMESSSSNVNNKRSLSPTAKRRKAKPRKRLPENAIPSDHDDSDALDLSTASPELCMDTQDNPYDSADCQRASLLAASSTASTLESNNVNITSIKVEPDDNLNNQANDKDYNSNQKKCLSSPVGCSISAPATSSSSASNTSAALRMPIIPKLQPLSVSVSCSSAASSIPSTSAIQSSIIHQDIRRLCQYSRQSQQHKPTWTEEDMVQALEAVQSGRLTYALAARKFDIPKATLHYYVILMKAVEAVRSGRMTAEIAAIKYNVRTSILLDCLFGRQSSSSAPPPPLVPPVTGSSASATVTPVSSSSNAGGGGLLTSVAASSSSSSSSSSANTEKTSTFK